jgi:hypothetical protein
MLQKSKNYYEMDKRLSGVDPIISDKQLISQVYIPSTNDIDLKMRQKGSFSARRSAKQNIVNHTSTHRN